MAVPPLRVLLVNQCFHPDHVATAQHLTDLAVGLAGAGHEVTVVASSRGYDNPSVRYPIRETWNGIGIRRIWIPGLGKSAKWRRAVDFGVFWLMAAWQLLRAPKPDVIVSLTSPPLIASLSSLVSVVRGGATVPWVMDLNPDEAVAAGWLKAGGLPERVMSALQNWSFGRASRVVALDRFMAQRLRAKGVPEQRIHVDAPWSHDDAVRYDVPARDAFRAKHGLTGKFVVMYSGNHSPCHPLDTLLNAAERLAAREDVHFAFIGGGSEFAKVKRFVAERGLKNVLTLPYQPLDQLAGSLSSADLHVVVMGEPFVGIVHPCKIYNILALGLPFLGIGPEASHLTDLAARLDAPGYARLAAHGDADGVVRQISEAADRGPLLPSDALRALGAGYSMQALRPRFVGVVESAARGA